MRKSVLFLLVFFCIMPLAVNAAKYTSCQCPQGQTVPAYYVYYQCPQLNLNQTYTDDEQIDIAGDAVAANPNDPTIWNLDLRLKDSVVPGETLYLVPTSPQYDQISKTWDFTCYPYNTKAFSAIKIVRKDYPKCVVDNYYTHAVRCTLTYKPKYKCS